MAGLIFFWNQGDTPPEPEKPKLLALLGVGTLVLALVGVI
jgi:hypothetical protein